MRIIGGRWSGRKFHPPANIPTRPTTDFAKEAMFNMLDTYYNFDNIKYLDLFGGTGSLSFEFASRGCKDITTVERFPKCTQFMNKTIKELGIEGMKVLQMDVFVYIEQCRTKYDVIYAGPPYALETLDTLPDLIFEKEMVEGQGWFILEHNPNHTFESHPHFWKKKNYGNTKLSFFTNEGQKTKEE